VSSSSCALQCVAVCCSVSQCVAVCCSVLQCVAVCCSLQCVAVCCSVLQYVAVCTRKTRYLSSPTGLHADIPSHIDEIRSHTLAHTISAPHYSARAASLSFSANWPSSLHLNKVRTLSDGKTFLSTSSSASVCTLPFICATPDPGTTPPSPPTQPF